MSKLTYLTPVSSRSAAVSAALCLVLLAGCKTKPNADVVATVNGHAIMRTEMEKMYLAQLGDAAQQQATQQPQEQPSGEQADSLRLGVLRELIDEEIVQQRAAKMNLVATDADVDAKLAEMKAPYTEEQFEARLKASSHTLDDVKHDLRRSLTIDKLLNKEINSKITISDGDISNYFNHHKAEFNNIETQYHLAQILVTSDPSQRASNLQGSKAGNDDEARKKIAALRNRIDSGEDFGSLAMNFSENPQNSSSGGDMGSISESQLRTNAGVFAAIGTLKVGGVTGIMPFPDPSDPKKIGGYAIFQLIARDPAGQHNVTEPQIQQRIRQGLRDARSQLLKGAFFEMLRDQSKVENYFAEQIFKNDAH